MGASAKGGLVALAAVLLLMCCGVVGLPILLSSQQAFACAPGGPLPDVDIGLPAGQLPAWDKWTSEKVTNAAIIVSVGTQNHVPARGWVIAVATAIQESGLRNVDYGDEAGPDSRGLFQQRDGWGPLADRMNPAKAARMFYLGGQHGQRGLMQVPGWEQMRLTDAAQAVQISGTPEAYQQHEEDAMRLAAYVAGLPNLDQVGGGLPGAPCGIGALPPVVVGPGGWTQPVVAKIGSPYGPRNGNLHAGVDLSAARNTPIRAASAGVVSVAECARSTGNCDVDGGVEIHGCGWYVEIRHASNIMTRYCHMGHRPQVTVGQTVPAGAVLGFVGSSGNSSGPHLHYEVHRTASGRGDDLTSTDPVPWHVQVGAPLGLAAASS